MEKYSKEYFAEMGRIGGKKVAKKYGKSHMSAMAKKSWNVDTRRKRGTATPSLDTENKGE